MKYIYGREVIGERRERLDYVSELMRGLREDMVQKLEEALASMPKGYICCVHEDWDWTHHEDNDPQTFKITQQLHFLDRNTTCLHQGRKTQYWWPDDRRGPFEVVDV